MKLNGWQRLWVVVSVPMFLLGALNLYTEVAYRDGENIRNVMNFFLVFGVGAPLALYAAGWIFVWIKRGFTD